MLPSSGKMRRGEETYLSGPPVEIASDVDILLDFVTVKILGKK
jgi:hypothetical protein